MDVKEHKDAFGKIKYLKYHSQSDTLLSRSQSSNTRIPPQEQEDFATSITKTNTSKNTNTNIDTNLKYHSLLIPYFIPITIQYKEKKIWKPHYQILQKKTTNIIKKVSLNLPFSTFPAFCDKQVLKFQKSFNCAGLPARIMSRLPKI